MKADCLRLSYKEADWIRSESGAYGFESHHRIIMLTQAVQRMASREEEKTMGNVIHQLKVFALTLFEFALAALVNVICSTVSTLA
jgi:hypothetical protein